MRKIQNQGDGSFRGMSNGNTIMIADVTFTSFDISGHMNNQIWISLSD
jgi:hypothetical protein